MDRRAHFCLVAKFLRLWVRQDYLTCVIRPFSTLPMPSSRADTYKATSSITLYVSV
jgi:hypothetical protein